MFVMIDHDIKNAARFHERYKWATIADGYAATLERLNVDNGRHPN